jgi:hypothetical protein
LPSATSASDARFFVSSSPMSAMSWHARSTFAEVSLIEEGSCFTAGAPMKRMICSTPNCCVPLSMRSSKSACTHCVSAATKSLFVASLLTRGGSCERRPNAASL